MLAQFNQHHNQAMTLIEIVIVVALLAGVMIYAVPSMLKPEDHLSFFRQFQTEIKSAFDTTVLTATPHRLVIQPTKNSIHLESIPTNEAQTFSLASLKAHHAAAGLSTNDTLLARQDQFREWTETAPLEVNDHDNDRVIAPRSPLLGAKKFLIGPTWQPVEGYGHEPFKWSTNLRLAQYYVEHLTELVALNYDRRSEPTPIFLHFLPQGYVEKSALIFRDIDDPEQPPYVLIIHPHQGIATLSAEAEDALTYVTSSQTSF